MPKTRSLMQCVLFCLALLCLITGTGASSENPSSSPEPSLYFNFNEGGSGYAFDGSGNGNVVMLYAVSRSENGGCGKSVIFNGIDSYGEIPYRSQNHPSKEITVSAWFLTNSFDPQVLISTYEDGGYRLGFDDGNDLWWTLNLEGAGETSIPIQHESIRPGMWHHITGTYDGQKMKVYLDGILRNQMNVTGTIRYQYNNYVLLGADAGVYNRTDRSCPMYFRGSLDEVRIYDTALSYGQVMDDRFACSPDPAPVSGDFFTSSGPISSCAALSGSVVIGAQEQTSRILSFMNRNENGTWNVTLPPGSTLVVNAYDFYPRSYPDAWYIEISDEKIGRVTRSIAFPNRNNAPLKGDIPSGNATVFVRYFNGTGRFPSKVTVDFESLISPPPQAAPQRTILNYPIIVIYSASWATLGAIILVIVWLHRRRKKSKL